MSIEEVKVKRKGMVPAKLNDEQRIILVRMHAEGMAPKDMVAHIKNEWNIDFTSEGVGVVVRAKKFEGHLKRFREDYLKKIKDVPIANKRIRIDDLERIRKKVMKALEENPCETKQQKEEFRFFVRTLNDTIINAREEMEKKPQLIAGLGLLGDFSDKSDDELIAERDEILRQANRLVPGGTSESDRHSEGTQGTDSTESA